MGIAFHDLTPESHAALDIWLSHEPVQQESLEAFLPPMDSSPPPEIRRQPSTELVELVQLLVKKGIVTRMEAVGLLRKSLAE